MEETLGKRIAAHRKALGLTQDALAEQLGVTAQAVSKWENEQSCPDISLLPKLTKIFSTSADALLGIQSCTLPSPAPTPERPPEPAVSTFRQRLSAPGAFFGLWLFLTGLIFSITTFRHMLIGLWDISIACAVFVFGLSAFTGRLSLLRLGCAIAGGLFLIQFLDPSIADIDWTVPLAGGIALLGMDLLLDALRNPGKSQHPGFRPQSARRREAVCDNSRFLCDSLFGDSTHTIRLDTLTRGSGFNAFGEMTVELQSGITISPGCTIDLDCIFGSLELRIPGEYRLELHKSAAFGQIVETGTGNPASGNTICVNCTVFFGQISIRYI